MSDKATMREAICARAAQVEAQRQVARERFDIDTQRRCERELAALWKQWQEAA